MTIPKETLMAYIDGELDPGACDEVERALRTDPELAAQATQYRDLRARLESAYAPELAEPVPERLLAVLRTPTRASVTELDEVRAARRAAPTPWAATASIGTPWRLTSMAAGVLLAVGAGLFIWRNSQSLMTQAADGTLLARGALARSLSNQLAGDSVPSPKVTIGLSFLAKSGDYCRTFSIAHGAEGSGLACRRGGEWQIGVLSRPEAAAQGDGSQYRTAGSSLPPAVLSAVQAKIAGDPLDRAAEVAARGRGWRAKP
jgi:negative regulator of sigma E activity